MLAPATGLLAVFIIIPMLLTIWLSFQNWSTQTGFETATFVGVQNFLDIFASNSVGRDFKAALVNTALYTVGSVAIILPLSVLLGLLVHQKIAPGGVFLRTVLFSNVRVHSYSKVEWGVLMPGVEVGRRARLTRVVVDRGCQIPDDMVIGEDAVADAQRFYRTASGITLVTAAMLARLA